MQYPLKLRITIKNFVSSFQKRIALEVEDKDEDKGKHSNFNPKNIIFSKQ